MQETAHWDLDSGEAAAVYASLIDIQEEQKIAAYGYLVRAQDGATRMGVNLSVEEDCPQPPAGTKPFADFFEVSGLLHTVIAKVDAYFSYRLEGGLRSLVPLPAPLLLGSMQGPTHIEAITLSRRADEGLAYSIGVETGDGEIRHAVSFQVKMTVTDEMPLAMLQGAAEFSKGLLGDDEEES